MANIIIALKTYKRFVSLYLMENENILTNEEIKQNIEKLKERKEKSLLSKCNKNIDKIKKQSEQIKNKKEKDKKKKNGIVFKELSECPKLMELYALGANI